MLTAEQKKRLANEARTLAYRVAEGNGPRLTNNEGWCGCAAGVVMLEAGMDPRARGDFANEIDDAADWSLLTHAVMQQRRYGRCALIFPLLATADALEAEC